MKQFHVTTPDDLARDMSDLASRLGVDQAEVFRRAMSLYIRAKRDEGARILLEDPQGRITELVGI